MKSKPVKYNPYRQARYVISAHDLKQLPPDTGVDAETALVDRMFESAVGTLELFGVYLGTRLGIAADIKGS